jgi:hypothetical protein
MTAGGTPALLSRRRRYFELPLTGKKKPGCHTGLLSLCLVLLLYQLAIFIFLFRRNDHGGGHFISAIHLQQAHALG